MSAMVTRGRPRRFRGVLVALVVVLATPPAFSVGTQAAVHGQEPPSEADPALSLVAGALEDAADRLRTVRPDVVETLNGLASTVEEQGPAIHEVLAGALRQGADLMPEAAREVAEALTLVADTLEQGDPREAVAGALRDLASEVEGSPDALGQLADALIVAADTLRDPTRHRPDAVWRAIRRTPTEGWGASPQGASAFFHDVDFPTPASGYAAAPYDGDSASVPSRRLAGDVPTVMRTTDGGRTWDVVKHGDAVGAVAFTSTKLGVAVSRSAFDGPAIFRTTTGGVAWDVVHVHGAEFTLELRDVAISADGHAVAVGNKGVILHSANAGETWDPVSSGTTRTLNGVAFVPGTNVAVAVGGDGTVLSTDNGGQSWESVGDVPGGVDLRDVAFAAGDDRVLGVVVGVGGTGVWRSSTPAQSWDAVDTPLTNVPAARRPGLHGASLAFDDDLGGDDVGGFVGYLVGDRRVILELQDGGSDDPGGEWSLAVVDARNLPHAGTEAASLASGSQPLTAVAAVLGAEGGTALAVGTYGAMVKRTGVDDLATETRGDEWWQCVPDAGGEDAPPVDEPSCPKSSDTPEPPPGEGHGFGPVSATECGVAKEDQADEMPCRWTWEPLDESGNPVSVAGTGIASKLFFNEDFGGRGRRVLLVRGGIQGKANRGARVFLFDPDRRQQRGVVGFGSGFPEGSASREFGERNGVINLVDAAEISENDFDSALQSPVAQTVYDAGRERLYLPSSFCGGGGSFVTSVGEDRDCVEQEASILAVDLIGDRAPQRVVIPRVGNTPVSAGRTAVRVRALGFDKKNAMLYALTETEPVNDAALSIPSHTLGTVHVTLYAFFVGDDPETTDDDEGAAVDSTDLRWTLPLEDQGCRTTKWMNPVPLGVSPDGDALVLPCQGHSVPHFGSPQFESHQIVTVGLNLIGRHPRELDPRSTATDASIFTEPVAGKVLAETPALKVDELGVLAWRPPGAGATLWDFDERGWIGSVPFSGIRDISGDPSTGRLYLPCASCIEGGSGEDTTTESGVLVAETLNLPVESLKRQVVLRTEEGSSQAWGEGPLVVPPLRDGAPPLLFARPHSQATAVNVYEDRIPPALPQRRPDPDVATHPDVSENEASEVTRIGRASAYGARLWWTGLGSSSPGFCEFPINAGGLTDPCGSMLTYNWLWDRDGHLGVQPAVPFGEHTSRVPSPPSGASREVRLGDIRKLDLENNKSGGRSQAEAVGVFYDGGPADNSGGTTGDEAKRRRGMRDAHGFGDAELGWLTGAPGAEDESQAGWEGSEAELCSRFEDDPEDEPDPEEDDDEEQQCRDFHDDFRAAHGGSPPDDPEDDGEFCDRFSSGDEDGPEHQSEGERRCRLGFDGHFGPWALCFDEAVDVAMREVDGDRRVRGCDPPEWEGFSDEHCGDDPKTGEREDCFTTVAENDPRGHERAPEPLRDRRGFEERAGWTYPSQCLDPGDEGPGFAGSTVRCETAEFGRAEAAAGVGPLSMVPQQGEGVTSGFSVGATGSQTEAWRDADDGIVVEVSAFAADVELSVPERGALSIGQIRTTARAQAKGVDDSAKSWVDVAYEDVVVRAADGRQRLACGQSDPDEAPVPGTGVQAGVTSDPATSEDPEGGHVGPCDPQRVVDVINTVFTDRVVATTSAPDDDPETRGSDGGAQAIVQRDPRRVMSDQVVNRIQGLWELPGLQLTIYNDGQATNRVQIDLAAVYAETHYEIGQALVDVPPSPGAVVVELSDPAEAPLAAGEFTLFEDADGDGAVGGADTPLDECTTDSSGSCRFDGLDAGSYVVEQRGAPVGFLAQEGAVGVFVSEGSTQTVGFVNAPDSASVVVELVNPQGRPLPGGAFEMVRDVEGNGLDPSDQVAVACVTGGDGSCRFDGVPLGGWVLHQAGAPSGFQTADDIPFSLLQPGQVARIRVVNGTGVAGATVEIIEIVGSQPASSSSEPPPSWWAAIPKGLVGILLRNPLQALLFALTGLLFGAPAYLAHRRRELAIVRDDTS